MRLHRGALWVVTASLQQMPHHESESKCSLMSKGRRGECAIPNVGKRNVSDKRLCCPAT